MSAAQRRTIPLHLIAVDPEVHGRARVCHSTVRQYADTAGDSERDNPMPPVDVFLDSQGRAWLADGFLRFYGLHAAGHRIIVAHVHNGERRDAVRFACGANAQHGLPRTRSDKRSAAAAMLLSREHAELNDSEIGRRCGVSHTFVAQLRPHCASAEGYDAWRGEQERKRNRARLDRENTRNAQETAYQEQAAEQRAKRNLSPPEPDRPLTAREQATKLLARAAESALRAKQAVKDAQQAYPEASHVPAILALAEARYALDDLLPEELKTLAKAGHRETLKVLSQVGAEMGLKGGDGAEGERDERRGARHEQDKERRVQPETLQRSSQPETLQPAAPEASSDRGDDSMRSRSPPDD